MNVSLVARLSALVGCLAWFFFGLWLARVPSGSETVIEFAAVVLIAASLLLLGVFYQCSRHHTASDDQSVFRCLVALSAMIISLLAGAMHERLWRNLDWQVVASIAALFCGAVLFWFGRLLVRRTVGPEPPDREKHSSVEEGDQQLQSSR